MADMGQNRSLVNMALESLIVGRWSPRSSPLRPRGYPIPMAKQVCAGNHILDETNTKPKVDNQKVRMDYGWPKWVVPNNFSTQRNCASALCAHGDGRVVDDGVLKRSTWQIQNQKQTSEVLGGFGNKLRPPCGGFHKWGYPKWMVCNGKSY